MPSLWNDHILVLDDTGRMGSCDSVKCRWEFAGPNRSSIFTGKLLFLWRWTFLTTWAMQFAVRQWRFGSVGASYVAMGHSSGRLSLPRQPKRSQVAEVAKTFVRRWVRQAAESVSKFR